MGTLCWGWNVFYCWALKALIENLLMACCLKGRSTHCFTVTRLHPWLLNSMLSCDWLMGSIFQTGGDPPSLSGCHGNRFYSTLVHTQTVCCLKERTQTNTTTDVIWGGWKYEKSNFLFFARIKTNGWVHWAPKLHLDWISSSFFQQLLFTCSRQRRIQLWSHPVDVPAHWILSLLYRPFVSRS